MEHDNGRKRGFGPHGEGCECDELEQGEHSPEEEPEGTESSREKTPRMLLSVREDPNDLLELMFVAISDAFSQQASDLILFCDFDGVPLTDRQIVRLNGAMMRGLASAKAAAQTVRQNFIIAAMQAQMREEAPAEAEPQPETGHGVRNISELFRTDPPE